MAHILTVSRGLPSVVYPGVELARRLAAAGHHVTLAAETRYRGLAEHHGLAFLDLASDESARFLEGDAASGRLRRWRDVARRRALAAAATAAERFVEDARALSPDLVLLNGEMHEHIVAAAATGVPIALLNTFVSIWRQPGVPPPHVLARPGVGWRGSRAGTALLWGALRARKRVRAWSQWARHAGCDRVSVIGELARRAGFDLRRATDASQWLIPFTYRRLPVLSLHAREFEFSHRPPPHVHYLGPMILGGRVDRPMPPAARAALDAVLARRRGAPAGRALIYAGFGSAFSTDRVLLERLVRAVAARPAWELVIGLGGAAGAPGLGTLPDRVHAFPWVPQVEVLACADAVVTHGGINTIDECVLAGVPVLVYCGGATDMAGTTARVVHHGIGLAGDGRRDGPPAIAAHLERLLHDPEIPRNVQRLRRAYAAYAGEHVAERTVAALLA
jgi:UDP:flavonoid glycosyltransferase YjiC (YdhE family)